jgi:hypothetical protein
MALADTIEDEEEQEALKMTSVIYRENKKVSVYSNIFAFAMKGGQFLLLSYALFY